MRMKLHMPARSHRWCGTRRRAIYVEVGGFVGAKVGCDATTMEWCARRIGWEKQPTHTDLSGREAPVRPYQR
jgi:hypothetical protein